jgi:hypothetical protein
MPKIKENLLLSKLMASMRLIQYRYLYNIVAEHNGLQSLMQINKL